MRLGQASTDDRPLVVAEIGNNHEGRFDVAERLVREAANAGVDAVKFQTFKTHLFTAPVDPARIARLEGFELGYERFAELGRLARSLGIGFFSTPLDLESARFLAPRVDAFKIASGDNDFVQLLDFACESGKPVIVSTGMTDLAGVATIEERVGRSWARHGVEGAELALLHCVSAYPVPVEQANVAAVATLRARFPRAIVGYSDHTTGLDACLLAVALGARIVEKHFTLDKHFSDFRDHQLSADPAEMRELVRRVAEASSLLGDGAKRVMPCEAPVAAVARRSVSAARDLAAGHVLSADDLVCLRPAGGIEPERLGSLVGKTSTRALARGEQLRETDVA